MNYFGFYSGIVKNNDDSSTNMPYRGRIQVYVPEIYGDKLKPEELPWAEPCFPLMGSVDMVSGYGVVGIPALDTLVWVGFEAGDPQRPIWFGCRPGMRAMEMPSEIVKAYPTGVLVKAPVDSGHNVEDKAGEQNRRTENNDGLFLLLSSSKVVLAYDKDNRIELDKENNQLMIKSSSMDITVTASGGKNIMLTAAAEGDNADGGEVIIRGRTVNIMSDENIQLVANAEMLLRGKEQAVLSSDRAIYGSAPESSGFESH